ncbi:MAG: hypothetical protein M1820_003616 [Bogoriella megaspora]|nr:MAG: hypothetical protein M1820_003616 [Bogoriella megaspora]
MAPQCEAISLSDDKRCTAEATSSDGLFCSFHSQQCYGLYRGYKSRNAKLDALNDSTPEYLSRSKTALVNNAFQDVDDEPTLNEIHAYLFSKYGLLDRVIRARKLHHNHFYSLSMDYGHQAYLDKLQSERTATLRALENVQRRTIEVLHKRQSWLKWVRQSQEDEDKQKENEKKIVKKEAALIKRHWKEAEHRMQQKRMKEHQRMQEEFLNKAYEERMAEKAEEDLEAWDPIEDSIGEEREKFVDMMRRLLWLETPMQMTESPLASDSELMNGSGREANTDSSLSKNRDRPETLKHAEHPQPEQTPVDAKKVKKQAKKARIKEAKEKEAKESDTRNKEAPPKTNTDKVTEGVTKPMNEGKTEARNRLIEGQEHDPFADFKSSLGSGFLLGSFETLHLTMGKTPGLPVAEANKLIDDVSEVRQLLFCRMLLAHANLLPTALQANSVEEFLSNQTVTAVELRDLCLRLEQPTLQEIRDACADLARGDELEEENVNDSYKRTEEVKSKQIRQPWYFMEKKKTLPKKWASKQERAIRKKEHNRNAYSQFQLERAGVALSSSTGLNFGVVDNRKGRQERVKIKVCGKTIWNFPSENSMARGGWLQWTVMAKDSNLTDAMKLCRNWDEFWELNILAIFGYFPSARYGVWAGDRLRQQWLQMGLIPYHQYIAAEETTSHHQVGGRGQQGQFHAMAESRNLVCFHIKRNDPASRRFIKYLTMQTWIVLTLVRDATDGRIIAQPPEDELWLQREKYGAGRASKNKWTVLRKVGKKLFEEIDKQRDWRFGFDDYYDVWIWDNMPGNPFGELYSTVTNMMIKAYRFRNTRDFYKPSASILKTITREEDTFRCRDIRPGDTSIYDHIQGPGMMFVYGEHLDRLEPPEGIYHDEADAAEDRILFPDEDELGNVPNALITTELDSITQWEEIGPDIERFVNDKDTDDGYSDEDDEFEDDGLGDEDEEDEFGDDEPAVADDEAGLGYHHTLPFDKLHEAILRLALPEQQDYRLGEEQLDTLVERDLEQHPFYEPDPEVDFFQFVERQQAKAFKPGWHAADTEPGLAGQFEAVLMTNSRVKYDMTQPLYCGKIFQKLGIHIRDHKYVMEDLTRATAMMGLFFPSDFLQSGWGKPFADSKLFDSTWRAENLRDRRTDVGLDQYPEDFFKPWDDICDRVPTSSTHDSIEWDKVTRSVIARRKHPTSPPLYLLHPNPPTPVYVAGVIQPSLLQETAGEAIALTEPTNNRETLDFYIDYRAVDINPASYLTDPSKIDLLSSARVFLSHHPHARFALLRIYSPPHFWPCMSSIPNRPLLSFTDCQRRNWEWRFLPKDSPFAAWSMHYAVKNRILPFEKWFNGVKGPAETMPARFTWELYREGARAREVGEGAEEGKRRVVVKRDMVLVMAEGEEDLREVVTGVGYVLGTRPWRLEVDLWRSFVNVGMGFLEELERLGWMK